MKIMGSNFLMTKSSSVFSAFKRPSGLGFVSETSSLVIVKSNIV